LVILVVAHATFDALFSPLGSPLTKYPAAAVYLVMGVLFLQPVLFAMWAALGSQPYFKRVPWAIVACVLVAYAQSMTWFRVVGTPSSSTGAFESLVMILVLFSVTALAFFAIRWLSSWRIDQRVEDDPQSVGDLQFGLRYLLGWVTASALLMAAGRVLAETGAFGPRGGPTQTMAQLLAFIGVVCVMLFPTVGVPWLTLACRYRRQTLPFVVGWLLAWCALTWAAVSLFRAAARVTAREVIEPIVLIQVGAAAAGFASALPLRIAGFRLRRSKVRQARSA
jgi:hypothetical protein